MNLMNNINRINQTNRMVQSLLLNKTNEPKPRKPIQREPNTNPNKTQNKNK